MDAVDRTTVPEATIDENRDLCPRKDNVGHNRRGGRDAAPEPITEA